MPPAPPAWFPAIVTSSPRSTRHRVLNDRPINFVVGAGLHWIRQRLLVELDVRNAVELGSIEHSIDDLLPVATMIARVADATVNATSICQRLTALKELRVIMLPTRVLHRTAVTKLVCQGVRLQRLPRPLSLLFVGVAVNTWITMAISRGLMPGARRRR
jgi:hypothetical protein